MYDYQLIVVGAGPGGYVAALRAAKLGRSVAVIERRETGGTCLNRGCVPTKTLLHSSQVYHEMVTGANAGITAQSVQVDMGAIFAHKRQVSRQLSEGIEGMFQKAGITLISGRALVSAPHTVQVTDSGEIRTVTAEDILIATGSVPVRPPIPGLDLPGVMTSDELLEGSDKLYESIAIIGGGVIGTEFATFYSDLGCEVTILEGLPRLLPTLDRELGQNLGQILKRRGVQVLTKATVDRVEQADHRLVVHYTDKKGIGSVTAEKVLCAIGRRPNLDGLFSTDFTPAQTEGRIQVDERFQTSLPNVYAIGDVSAKIQLAHMASAQGTAFADLLCGVESVVDLNVVPSCIYTRPEIAVVGLSEQEAKEAGISAQVGKSVLFGNARTVIVDGDRCLMKVVARTDSREVIGAQLMCQNATDMISELAQAVSNRLTVEQLMHTMRPHPTFAEALGDALENLAEKLG